MEWMGTGNPKMRNKLRNMKLKLLVKDFRFFPVENKVFYRAKAEVILAACVYS